MRMRSLIDLVGNEASCRTICDPEHQTFFAELKAELLGLHRQKKINSETSAYINSLSLDIMCLVARILRTSFLTIEVLLVY